MTTANRPCTEPGKCRSCQAAILWVKWPKSGKKMPVDKDPVPNGNVVLTLKQSLNELHAEKFNPGVHASGRNRYVSHFTTCPQSSEHRRG